MKKCKDCNLLLDENKFEKNRRVCKKCRLEKRKNTHKLTCKTCKKDFTNARKDVKFCSKTCQSKDRENKKEVSCDYCGKNFKVKKSRKYYNDYIYCSYECKNKNNTTRILIECNYCKKTIEKPFKYKDKNGYCSSECFYSYNIGSNVHNYNPNISKKEREEQRKTPEYREWRINVFKRDYYTCQCCKNKNGITLNAHHIENFSEHKDKRYSLNNGITLCKECHQEFHKQYTYFNNNKKQLKDFFISKNANTEVIENITQHRRA